MKGPFPPSGKATLTIETIGRERILRSREIAQILEVVSIDTASWVQGSKDGRHGFSAVLNNLVDAFLTKKLETETDRQARKKLQRMRSHLEDYMEAARTLKNTGFPPPYLPKEWYDNTMEFYADLQAKFDERSSGGRKEAIPEWEFIAECAALFSLAFNIEPTSTAPGARQETGAFSRFVVAIDQACRERLLVPGTAVHLLPTDFRHQVFLATQSDNRLRKLIDKALQYSQLRSAGNESPNEGPKY